ncbi:MAG: hypothetical protein ACI83E_001608 [Sulfitobacter sp.]
MSNPPRWICPENDRFIPLPRLRFDAVMYNI